MDNVAQGSHSELGLPVRSYRNLQALLWQIDEKICSKLGEKPEGLQEGKGCAVHSLGYLALAYNNFARAAYFFEQFFGVNALLRRTVQPNFTFYRERKQKKTKLSPSLSLPLEIFLRYSCSREFVYI